LAELLRHRLAPVRGVDEISLLVDVYRSIVDLQMHRLASLRRGTYITSRKIPAERKN